MPETPFCKTITVSRSLVADSRKAKAMFDALHSTLAVLNPLGVEIVTTMMERLWGVSCTENYCSSKEEIEEALLCVLGREAGTVVIREWNKKLQSVRR